MGPDMDAIVTKITYDFQKKICYIFCSMNVNIV